MGVVLIENFNIKKSINIFGDRAETAVMKELQTIHDMNTYKPMDASKPTHQQIKYALASLLFITENRSGYIKAKKVAVGSNQRTYDSYARINGSSTTVNTDSVFLTWVIDSHGHRSIEILDIEDAFMHAENDEFVLMLIRGNLAELLVKVDPKLYRKYVIKYKQGVPML